MKILHTSDWHVGKVLKGRDRYDEHVAVLGSIVRIARAENVDLVLVAGDLFDSAAPSAKAQGLVMRTLLALGRDGRQVIAIAGNHDSPAVLDGVYQPVLGQAGVHVLGTPKRPKRGGLITMHTGSGETVNVAALPFLSHQHAARAAQALPPDLAEHAIDYPSQMAAMLRILTRSFTSDAVNLVTTHATLPGGHRGGGERDGQTGPAYELPPGMFPPSAQYAALGHLHNQQEIPGPCPIVYSGSPLAVDFGDIQNVPCVLIVSTEPGKLPNTRAVPITDGRSLQTLHGTLDEVITAGEQMGDAYLRVVLAEPGRTGLGDLVRDKLPNALEVVLDEAHQPRTEVSRTRRVSRIGRNPLEVFGDYLTEENIVDPRLKEVFAELFEQVMAGPSAKAEDAAESPSGATNEADSAEEVIGEVSDNPQLLDNADEDDDWEYLDAAGPPAADPTAASAIPWDGPTVSSPAETSSSEDRGTTEFLADPATAESAVSSADPDTAETAPEPAAPSENQDTDTTDFFRAYRAALSALTPADPETANSAPDTAAAVAAPSKDLDATDFFAFRPHAANPDAADTAPNPAVAAAASSEDLDDSPSDAGPTTAANPWEA